jgi:putative membrane protein insertion efficiency factor
VQIVVKFLKRICRAMLIAPVRVYQLAIGPILPKVCRYEPSCSEYFVLAVEKHGAARGAWKGVCRICRCHPWGASGFDPP